MPAKITKEIYEQRISEKFPDQEYEILSFNGIDYQDSPDSLETIQSKINSLFGEDEFEALKFDKKTNKLTIKHKCGFIRTMDRARFYDRGLCPQCDKATSAGEADIARFLTKKGIPYQTQKTYRDLLSENKKPLRFDFCIDDRLIIEFNGMQHYKPVDYFGGEETFKKTILHDSMKEEYCKKNNIPYLIIPYWQDKQKESMIISFLKCNDYSLEE